VLVTLPVIVWIDLKRAGKPLLLTTKTEHKSMQKIAFGFGLRMVMNLQRSCGRRGLNQTLLIMRLTVLLLTAAFLNVQATGKGQNITLTGKDLTLQQVFKAIEKQSGYVALGNEGLFTGIKTVSLSVSNLTVKEVLDIALKDMAIRYIIKGKTIVLSRKPAGKDPDEGHGKKYQHWLLVDAITVRIRVTDSVGHPLHGATITVRNKKISGVTGADGMLSLNLNPGDVIEVSFVGYGKQYITIKNNSATIDVMLRPAENQMEEFVFKGYYSESRKLSTGSVGKIRTEEIERQPVGDIMGAMYARIPGVEITQATGMPEGNFNIVIRGQNSLRNYAGNNGNLPLYIVDGVPIDLSKMNTGASRYAYPVGINGMGLGVSGVSPLSGFNPSDIASIEILKDADATAIYGSRGANGVVVITTKKRADGEQKAEINFSSGSGKVTRMLDMLHTEDYIRLRKERHQNDGTVPGPSEYDINGAWAQQKYTDWQRVLFGKSATMTNGQAAISGGDGQLGYRFAIGYNRETSVFPGDFGAQRKQTSLHLNHRSKNKKLQADFSINYSIGTTDLPMEDITSQATRLAPNSPDLVDANGNLVWDPGVNNLLVYTRQPYRADRKNLLASVNISYELWKNLVIKTSLGINNAYRDEIFKSPASAFRIPEKSISSSWFGNTNNESWTVEPQLTYQFNQGKHRVNMLVGMSFDHRSYETGEQIASGFSSEALMDNINAVPASSIITRFGMTDYRYSGGFGRINYTFGDKYVLNLTGRRDGSSRFGYGRQFANFAALGAAWIFSREQAFEFLHPVMNFGKLRTSYGSAGSDQAPDYSFLNLYGNSGDYDGVRSLIPTQLFNPDFAWEINRKFEVALETSWFSDRLQLNIAWYRNRSSNQLVGNPLPPSAGFNSVTANMPAVVQNTGLEIDLTARVIQKREWSWTAGFNISVPQNKLIAFPGIEGSAFNSQYTVGHSLNIRKKYEYTGIDQQTGLFTVRDVDGNGVYTTIDRTQLMFTGRRFSGGVTSNLSWKQFQLDVLLQFVKQQGQNYLSFMGYPTIANSNFPVEILNHWQKTGDQADFQKLTVTGNKAHGLFSESNASVSDASFIRLKNISLAYTLPEKIGKQLHMKLARVFIQGQNLLTLTRYRGLDPESQGLGLPPLTMLVGGVQLQF
jgi:TonB-linked SusC/RagA family outer membrane protein